MTVRLNASTVARVRHCGASTRGGASAYLERLVRQDALREAAEQHARWFTEHPAYLADAEAEAALVRDVNARWFEDSGTVEEVIAIFLAEQQTYHVTTNGKITTLRILYSGSRPPVDIVFARCAIRIT